MKQFPAIRAEDFLSTSGWYKVRMRATVFMLFSNLPSSVIIFSILVAAVEVSYSVPITTGRTNDSVTDSRSARF